MINTFTKRAVIALFLCLTACGSSQEPKLAVGDISRESLLANYPLFKTNFDRYSFTADEQSQIRAWPDDLEIEIFFGTWCHDSEREVPKILKIVHLENRFSTKLISLDYQKSTPSGQAKANNVNFTPTIIVKHNQKEIGRIVERPKKSIIADISEMM